jgi:hypothetical protein
MCKNLSFEECELTILRASVDKAEKIQGKKVLDSPETKKIIKMVEEFIKSNQCVVYGGTAINNVLPKNAQFYDYDYELPDYDFFHPDALELAKKLADLYAKKGIDNVEAKAGVHHGTYKVFVNNLGVADITYLHPELYKKIKSHAIKKEGILYAPANFLRQSMYLELSRPMGDVSRWEKVLKRLNLLNKFYPLKHKECVLQRRFTSRRKEPELFSLTKSELIKEGVVFIGGYANAIYTTFSSTPQLQNVPDFDVLSIEPKKTAESVVKVLKKARYDVTMHEHEAIGELVSKHYSISVDGEYIAFVFEPSACHSYNVINEKGKKLKIGTIDTLLSYYLAFMYAERDYFDDNRLLCLSSVLFQVQQENRLTQKEVLKRFVLDCYGKQTSLSEMKEENNKLHITLDKDSKEYEERFLKYVPKDKKRS